MKKTLITAAIVVLLILPTPTQAQSQTSPALIQTLHQVIASLLQQVLALQAQLNESILNGNVSTYTNDTNPSTENDTVTLPSGLKVVLDQDGEVLSLPKTNNGNTDTSNLNDNTQEQEPDTEPLNIFDIDLRPHQEGIEENYIYVAANKPLNVSSLRIYKAIPGQHENTPVTDMEVTPIRVINLTHPNGKMSETSCRRATVSGRQRKTYCGYYAYRGQLSEDILNFADKGVDHISFKVQLTTASGETRTSRTTAYNKYGFTVRFW